MPVNAPVAYSLSQMASASTSYMRLLLRVLYKNATDSQIALQDALIAAASSRVTETQNGKVLIASSGNGRTLQFSVPGNSSPMELAETISELLDRYDEASEKLGGSASDQAIYDEMMLMLQPRDGYSNDFGGLRECREEVES